MALLDFRTGHAVEWRKAIADWRKGYSPTTQRFTQWVIAEVEATIGKEFLEVTETDAHAYVAACLERKGCRCRAVPGKEQKVTKNTVLHKINTLHATFDKLKAWGFATRNPFDSALESLGKAPSGTKQEPMPMPEDDVRKLLRLQFPPTKSGVRDQATIAILFGGGLRIGEVRALLLADIRKTEDGYALCLRETKSQRPQVRYLPEWAEQRLHLLLLQRQREGGRPEEPLLVNYFENETRIDAAPLCYDTLRKRWEKWLRLAGILGIYSPHSARVTFCCNLLDAGEDRKAIQEAMGHSTQRMVEVYDKRHFTGKNSAAKKANYGA